MIARRLVIRGRVQGVSYRWWAVETARSLGVTGWVRNRRDGSVEAVATGSKAAVAAFAEACRKGPSAARVESVDQEPVDVEPFDDFETRPTA